MNISIPDTILILIILISAFWGMFKGFISQIISIIALIIGVWCAFKFSNYLALNIKEFFSITSSSTVLQVVIFIAILLIVMIIGKFLARGLETLIKISMLGWLNKLLGFIFAALKAIIILGLVCYAIKYCNDLFNFIPNKYLETSKCYTNLISLTNRIFPYLNAFIK